jgi:hypothetical protein
VPGGPKNRRRKEKTQIRKMVLKEIALKWPDVKKTPGNDNDV